MHSNNYMWSHELNIKSIHSIGTTHKRLLNMILVTLIERSLLVPAIPAGPLVQPSHFLVPAPFLLCSNQNKLCFSSTSREPTISDYPSLLPPTNYDHIYYQVHKLKLLRLHYITGILCWGVWCWEPTGSSACVQKGQILSANLLGPVSLSLPLRCNPYTQYSILLCSQ